MSGHNKWSKIKRQKAGTDATRSKLFGKLVRYITVESKKSKGNILSPGLKTAIDKAKQANVPSDTIERAIKKGSTDMSAAMENVTYEAYGPGGCALIIEALTDNRNKASQEIKHILSLHGTSLAAPGAATWAFTRVDDDWLAQTSVPVTGADVAALESLIEDLEENDEVQEVYTNAE